MGGDCSQKLPPRRGISLLSGAQLTVNQHSTSRPAPVPQPVPSGFSLPQRRGSGARGRGDCLPRTLASSPPRLSYRLPGSVLESRGGMRSSGICGVPCNLPRLSVNSFNGLITEASPPKSA